MKILHTADWHLGQKFKQLERAEEHQLALDWLIKLIETEKIELLVLAGDVFDITNPPNYAIKIYYNFFKSLLKTTCNHCVVIAGNHDSPAMLSAPKDLLEVLNIKIVSSISENIEDEILEIKDQKGVLQAVVAAVPFLRDRDLKSAVAEEGAFERAEYIKKGIYQHYQNIANFCEKYDAVPVIATGHLYATGAQSSDKQDNIYIGNIENINAAQFSPNFDYVALGHIHRAQTIGARTEVRYSGSIIPLSFSEIQDRKTVTLITFNGKKIEDIKEIDVPSFRKLVRFKGTLEEVKAKISQLDTKLTLQKENETKLRAWVEVHIETETNIPNIEQQLSDFTKNAYLDILEIKQFRQNALTLETDVVSQNLRDMTVMEVFNKRLETVEPSAHQGLTENFLELLEHIHQND